MTNARIKDLSTIDDVDALADRVPTDSAANGTRSTSVAALQLDASGGRFRFFEDFDETLDTTLRWVKTGAGTAVAKATTSALVGSGFGVLEQVCTSGQSSKIVLGIYPVVGGATHKPRLRFRVWAGDVHAVPLIGLENAAGTTYIRATRGSSSGWALTVKSVVGGGGPTSVDNVGTFAAATWYDVLITYDGTAAKLYVNGALLATVNSATSMPTSAEVLAPAIQSTGVTGTGTQLTDFLELRGVRV